MNFFPIILLNSCYRMSLLVIEYRITLVIILLAAAISLPAFSNAELYRNFDGSYINEKQYEEWVLFCSDIQQNKGIDSSIDCADFVLTKEGNDFLVNWMFENRGNWLKGHVGSAIDCSQIEEC